MKGFLGCLANTGARAVLSVYLCVRWTQGAAIRITLVCCVYVCVCVCMCVLCVCPVRIMCILGPPSNHAKSGQNKYNTAASAITNFDAPTRSVNASTGGGGERDTEKAGRALPCSQGNRQEIMYPPGSSISIASIQCRTMGRHEDNTLNLRAHAGVLVDDNRPLPVPHSTWISALDSVDKGSGDCSTSQYVSHEGPPSAGMSPRLACSWIRSPTRG